MHSFMCVCVLELSWECLSTSHQEPSCNINHTRILRVTRTTEHTHTDHINQTHKEKHTQPYPRISYYLSLWGHFVQASLWDGPQRAAQGSDPWSRSRFTLRVTKASHFPHSWAKLSHRAFVRLSANFTLSLLLCRLVCIAATQLCI